MFFAGIGASGFVMGAIKTAEPPATGGGLRLHYSAVMQGLRTADYGAGQVVADLVELAGADAGEREGVEEDRDRLLRPLYRPAAEDCAAPAPPPRRACHLQNRFGRALGGRHLASAVLPFQREAPGIRGGLEGCFRERDFFLRRQRRRQAGLQLLDLLSNNFLASHAIQSFQGAGSAQHFFSHAPMALTRKQLRALVYSRVISLGQRILANAWPE